MLAQVSPEAQRRYTAAVKKVVAGDYDRAKTELNGIIQQRGSLAPYASYYYALAAYRQKNFPQARLALRQLADLFPDWRKMSDANYLLAAVSMETGQYDDALTAIQQITDPALRTDVTKLEQAFIPKITDLNRLKELNKAFPNDRVVGLTLIDLIQRTASDKDDLELSDRLTNRFGVPGVATTQPATTSSTTGTSTTGRSAMSVRTNRTKGYYNIAVMFPFRLDDFDSEKRNRSNQYVYDLYDGIKMAKTKLQEEGITVNLFAYDVDNDANKTLELVNSPAFAQTDLIIGPLYIEPNRIASAYANQSNIVLLNPIATSSDLVVNQPLSFLAQPSLNQQAHKLAEHARNLNGGRRVAVYYGSSRRDSLLAMAYVNELKQQNYQLVDVRKISGSVQSMADAMQLTGSGAASASASTSRPVSTTQAIPLGHVFFASSNDEEGNRMLDALNRRHVSGPLLTTASAFDFYRIPASTFARRDVYLLYPDYIDATRDPVVTFQEQYVAKRNTIPSVFASEGYDMMLFFGRQLAKNTLLSRNRGALHSDTDDYLLSGFDYSQSNENQIVPIVKFEDGKLVKVN
ncbi:tetratricopeptide repeat protein [Spirosoma gilvum]